MVKVIAIIQARLSSTRLPGKVLRDLNGQTLLERVVKQVRKADTVNEICLATSTRSEDDLIEIAGRKLGVDIYRGSLNNVLERFYEAAKPFEADVIVRVTADNPLVEPKFIDQGVKKLLQDHVDYVSFEQIPYGSGSEIFRSSALNEAQHFASLDDEREHVTPYILKHPEKYKIAKLLPEDESLRGEDIRVTIDTLQDYEKMYKLFFQLETQGKETNLKEAIKYKRMLIN